MNNNMTIANELALSTLTDNLMPVRITKATIEARAFDIVTDLMETGDPAKIIETVELVAAMDGLAEKIRKDERFTALLLDELAKHKGKYTTGSGSKIEAVEAGVQYNYSGNPEWEALDLQIKELIEQRKALEETLKAIKPGKMIVDADSGEVLTGAGKKSKSTYKFTMAKL